MQNKTVSICGYSNSIHFYRWCGFLEKIGFDVEIISFIKNNPEYDYKKFYKYRDFSVDKDLFKKLKQIFNFLKVIFIFLISRTEYINFNYIEPYILVLAFFVNKKIILTCWGSDILIKYHNSKRLIRFFYNHVLKKSFAITCDSLSVKKEIYDNCRKINPDKIKIVSWGIDTGLFTIPKKEEKSLLRKNYGIPENSSVVLSIRNVEKNYRIKDIIRQFNRINDKNIFLLVRVSAIYNKNYLTECKNEAENNQNINFINHEIPYGKINELYKISDINIHFPESDATPVSIFEAISSGNIILASSSLNSYRELSKKYNIKLAKLEEMDEDLINHLVNKKEEIIYNNRKNLVKSNSLDRTIDDLKLIFER